jgi:hypothetical protein
VQRQSLGHLAQLCREQGAIEIASTRPCAGIDDQVGQCVQITHCGQVAHHRALDAHGFGLAVDAFGTGALIVDGVVERALPIQHHAHASPRLPIGVFDTAFAEALLLMVAPVARELRKEQRAAKALGAVAVGVGELVAGMHTQAFVAQRRAIRVVLTFGMAVGVERDGSDAPTQRHHLVDIPGIEGGISGDVDGKAGEGRHGADVEGHKVAHIVLIERLGVLGQHHIAVAGNRGTGHPRAIAPQALFAVFLAVGLRVLGRLGGSAPPALGGGWLLAALSWGWLAGVLVLGLSWLLPDFSPSRQSGSPRGCTSFL